MKILITISIVLISFAANCQNSLNLKSRQDSINYLTQLIIKAGWVTSSNIDVDGAPSVQYTRFIFLLTMLTNKDFVNLAKKSKGCLRIYAFMGLYHNKYNKINEIAQLLKYDTSRIETKSGCLMELPTVANAIKRITHWYWKEQTDDMLVRLVTDKAYRTDRFNNISASF